MGSRFSSWSRFAVLAMCVILIPSTARAGRDPAEARRSISLSIYAHVKHRRCDEHPLGFASVKPSARIDCVRPSMTILKAEPLARFVRALDVERNWIASDSPRHVEKQTSDLLGSVFTIEFRTADGSLWMRFWPSSRFARVQDADFGSPGTIEVLGGIDCTANADTLLALLKEALPDDAQVAGMDAPRDSLLPPAVDGLPPFGTSVFLDEVPELTQHVPPNYPEEAVRRDLSGVVQVEALVDVSGRVAETRVYTADPLLEAAAIAAVEQWRFRPARFEGRPQPAWVTAPIKFNLH